MNKILKSSLISDVMWSRNSRNNINLTSKYNVTAIIPPTMTIKIVGESDSLANWQPENGVELVCSTFPQWSIPQSCKIEDGTQFKFILTEGDRLVCWESGENRVWNSEFFDLGEFRTLPEFKPKVAGVAIPVFSIKSEGCEGIGDFLSLADFAKWSSECGMRIVQTLPVNDTTIHHTWQDSYPYKAISIYALHPLYIRVSAIDSTLDVSELTNLENEQFLDYGKVDQLKWQLFREVYAKKGAGTLKSQEFDQFFAKNREWLLPYAVFSMLRDKFSTATFSEWDDKFQKYSKELVAELHSEFSDEVGLYLFLQFHADKQLRLARDAAREVGVVFKGDIPIGVSRDSVEVWTEPYLFNLNGQAGAPPDDFSVDGQNWGFPTYNWEEMAKDGYSWWKKRFKKMADYFDVYRIDHILGFFRIWEIPMPHKSGLLGHFTPSLPFSAQELEKWGLPMYEDRYLGKDDSDLNTLFLRDHKNSALYHPRISCHSTQKYQDLLDDYEKEHFNAIYNHYFYHRHNDFWAELAFDKLPSLIDATSMLCCAEDLGMIPDCVPYVLEKLQVATLEIQRMSKDSSRLFADTTTYPYNSVAATSTHDMSPIRGWWLEDRANTQLYFNQILAREGVAPENATCDICNAIIKAHLDSPSFAVILPWQDYMSINEKLRVSDPLSDRINIPANPKHYWRYRMHLNCNTLMQSKELNEQLCKIIESSERC